MIDLPAFPKPGANQSARQQEMRVILADALYGPVPDPPDDIAVTCSPLPGTRAERLEITLTKGTRHFNVDAAIWRPPETQRPAPLICGLDFVGPLGVIPTADFPLDPMARVYTRPEYGAPAGKLSETLRGTSAYRWPIEMLTQAGFAVMVSCYGSWVPDDPEHWKSRGVVPFLDAYETAAISLWAWALTQMVAAAGQFGGVDPEKIAVAGHSRLGKAALWAAANDPNIAAVFANNSGCGGAALARHPVGETLAQMTRRFPHWTCPDIANSPVETLPYDQHFLLAAVAPKPLYLASAAADLWADPEGTQAALDAAKTFADAWPTGHHIRLGDHDLLPFDWAQFLAFMDRCQF